MSAYKLEPCPCEGSPMLFDRVPGEVYYLCSSSDCAAGTTIMETEPEAARAWNRTALAGEMEKVLLRTVQRFDGLANGSHIYAQVRALLSRIAGTGGGS